MTSETPATDIEPDTKDWTWVLSEQGKHTLGDIFTIVSQNMPATLPASLPPDDYVRIMAYLLQENGYPAGSNELTFDAAKKSKVQLRYRGP